MTTTKMTVSAMSIAAVLCFAAGGAFAERAPPDDTADRGWKPGLDFPIQFSGYFWTDTGYGKRTNAQPGQYDQSAAYMQGRYALTASYGQELGDFNAAARVQLMGLVNEFSKSAYEPHTLDAYVRLGQKRWDFTLGRFLAWEVYYRGQGIELYTAEEAGAFGGPALYLLDYTRGLRNEAGQAAVHLYPTDWLSLEVAAVYGQEANQNNYGVRPVVDLKGHGFWFVAGAELEKQQPQTSADKVEVTSKGYAARLEYAFPIATLGVDVARTSIDSIDIQGLVDSAKTLDKTSLGGWMDFDFWKGSIGLGYHRTAQTNRKGENNNQQQMFVSYLYHLPFEGLSLKAVYGFARAHIEDIDARSQWENNLNSVRLRLRYQFH